MGKFLAEIRELDASLAVSPNDPGLLADRALMFLRSEDYELALEDSEEAAKLGPLGDAAETVSSHRLDRSRTIG